MKERVIKELYVLAQTKKSDYLPILKNELGLNENEIAERARKSLRLILHDYSRFSISTIDSFFQRVIKSFNRELGINVAYQVDLEDNLILEEAVDEMLLSIDENPELLDWLKLLMAEDIGPEALKERDPAKIIPPLHGALLKNEQDVHLFERLA